jgi:hypothetical protein
MPSLYGMMRKHERKHELQKIWGSGHFFVPSGINKPKQNLSENEKKYKLTQNARRYSNVRNETRLKTKLNARHKTNGRYNF